jgi:hypothetical protein
MTVKLVVNGTSVLQNQTGPIPAFGHRAEKSWLPGAPARMALEWCPRFRLATCFDRLPSSTKRLDVRPPFPGAVRTNGDFTCIMLTVAPLSEPEPMRGLFLVTFRPQPNAPARPKARPNPRSQREQGQPEAVAMIAKFVDP